MPWAFDEDVRSLSSTVRICGLHEYLAVHRYATALKTNTQLMGEIGRQGRLQFWPPYLFPRCAHLAPLGRQSIPEKLTMCRQVIRDLTEHLGNQVSKLKF